jgi:hypothetical protein
MTPLELPTGLKEIATKLAKKCLEKVEHFLPNGTNLLKRKVTQVTLNFGELTPILKVALIATTMASSTYMEMNHANSNLWEQLT